MQSSVKYFERQWFSEVAVMPLKSYLQKQPKQFGDMHERMHFLIAMISSPDVYSRTPVEVIHAIWDLKTEVEENHTRSCVGQVWPKKRS